MSDKRSEPTYATAPRAGRRFVSLAAMGVLTGAGLALGPGVPVANAVLGAPQLQNLRVEGADAYVDFLDNSDNENQFIVTVRERNNPDNVVAEREVTGNPGSGRTVTRTVGGVPTGVPLCATVRAVQRVENPLNPNRVPIEYPIGDESPPSNTVCTDPAAASSDLALQNVRGNESPQAGQSPAYLIEMRNAGTSEATGITVDVSTSGVATLGDQGAVQAGWGANGFACAPRPPSGGETSALHCTGGRLGPGAQTNPAVIVRFTGPGRGTVHAAINGAGDNNTGNNGTALNVTAG